MGSGADGVEGGAGGGSVCGVGSVSPRVRGAGPRRRRRVRRQRPEVRPVQGQVARGAEATGVGRDDRPSNITKGDARRGPRGRRGVGGGGEAARGQSRQRRWRRSSRRVRSQGGVRSPGHR